VDGNADPNYTLDDEFLSEFLKYAQTRPGSDSQLLEAVELEREVWDTYWATPLPQIDSREKLCGTTWTSLVVRQNHFVFQSRENPLHDVVFPIARSSFEHAVYLWLVAHDRIDENLMKVLDQRSLKQWQRTIENPDSDVPKIVSGTLQQMVSRLMPIRREKQVWITIFDQVCKKFEIGDGMYETYGRLSSFVHPGIQSGSLFIGDVLNPQSPLAEANKADSRLLTLLRTSLISTGSAMGAHDVIFDNPHFRVLVDKIASMFDLSDDEIRLQLKAPKKRQR
jgi:hypothetical protein